MCRLREFGKPLSCSWSARPRTFRFVRTTCRAAGALTREANPRRNHAPVRVVFIGVDWACSSGEHDECPKRKLPCRVPWSFPRLLPYTVANCAIQLVVRTVSRSIRSRLTKYARPGTLGTWIAPIDVTSTSGSIMSSSQ